MPSCDTRTGAVRALVLLAVALAILPVPPPRARAAAATPAADAAPDPLTAVWAVRPADKWENAYPVGNGRLGAMVFGRTDEERISLNEESYWSGGPYSTVVEGGHKALAEIRKRVFDGDYRMAHILFGRHLMGYPVEQMKYQPLGALVLRFPSKGAVTRVPAGARSRYGRC